MWKLINTYGMKKSYSQVGEDVVLDHILNFKQNGIYVDIGSNHPVNFSNTYLFYQRGWQGLCVEPNPDMFRLADKWRPRDKNICCGVASVRGRLDYYQFEEAGVNTCDKKCYERNLAQGYHFKGISKVQVMPLCELCLEYKIPKTGVDFLSVDAEEMDLEVLKSNDWSKFRPRIILVEIIGFVFENCFQHPTVSFLREQDYVLIDKVGPTSFFKRL